MGWVLLDEEDGDPSRFWMHLFAALQQIRLGVGKAALSWFYAREAPPVQARLSMKSTIWRWWTRRSCS